MLFSMSVPAVLGFDMQPDQLAEARRQHPTCERHTHKAPHQQDTHGRAFCGIIGRPSMGAVHGRDAAMIRRSGCPLTSWSGK